MQAAIKDIWAAYGGFSKLFARTLWVFYAEHKAGESSEHYGPAIIGRFQNRAMQVLAVVLSAPLWPLSLLAMLAAPYVMRNPNTKNVFAGNWSRYRAWRERPHYQYI